MPPAPPCLQPGGHAVMDKEIHAARFLRRHVRRDVKALHLARDLAREARGVEARDARDARSAGERVRPRLGDADADGAYDAKTGDNDSATAHFNMRRSGLRVRLDVVDGLLHGGRSEEHTSELKSLA